MTHMQQHLQDRWPHQTDDSGDTNAYVTGWTISGLAVIGTIVAVWLLGI